MFSLLLWSLLGQTEAEVVKPMVYRDVALLDQRLIRRRLEQAHGESGRRQPGTWLVAADGKTYEWTWDGEKLVCPIVVDGDPMATECKDWTPESFKWFEAKNMWLKEWESFNKRDYLLESEAKPQRKELSPEMMNQVLGSQPGEGLEALPAETINLATEVPEEAEEEALRLGGKRLALEAWEWVGLTGDRVRVYTSLRDSRVERIDRGDKREYIEWKSQGARKPPQIHQVILEKSGQRIRLTRKPPEKAAPKKP